MNETDSVVILTACNLSAAALVQVSLETLRQGLVLPVGGCGAWIGSKGSQCSVRQMVCGSSEGQGGRVGAGGGSVQGSGKARGLNSSYVPSAPSPCGPARRR